ncbi:MAG: hypothetical protein ACRDCQ_18200 [Aeromonas sobria]
MLLANMVVLGVSSVHRCIKVDDAVPGISEGLNAGMWSVGLPVSGNQFGTTLPEFTAIRETEVSAVHGQRISTRIRGEGALSTKWCQIWS